MTRKETMFATAIIVFREALEIAMILGVVLAATRGLPGRTRWVMGGLIGGLLGAGLVAVFAESISAAMAGMGQEMFNAIILFTAALMIGWTVVWIRTHAREMTLHLRTVGYDVRDGKLPFYSLSLIVGLALLREGSEITLFIYGMLASGQPPSSIITGSLTGLVFGTVAGIMLYYGLIKLSARYMLSVTSWLLMLLVAGLTAQGAGYLSAAGYFSTLSAPVWDSSWLLSDTSLAGQALHSLIGYTAQPTMVELLFYFGALLGLLALMRLIAAPRLAQ